jgi:TolA-binding protein
VTPRVRLAALLLAGIATAGCATKGQLREIETQLAIREREQERRDSTLAVALQQILRVQQATLDSLDATRRQVSLAKGETSAEAVELQRRILNLQEQMSQNNQRMNEFLAQLDARQAALLVPTDPTDSLGAAPSGGTATAVQMLEAANTQLRRGGWATARSAYQELLVTHPLSPLVPDALFGIAESYATTVPDSATAYYLEVARIHPDSPKAASAMFKLGTRAQQRGDLAEARRWYTQVVDERYRGTAEYDLARDRLRQLP